jgi:hypothetical protein
MLNALSQSTMKPLHSYFPHTCWVRQVLTLAINNVAQKEEATPKSCEDVAGSRRTQPPVDYLWSLVPSFPGLSVNSDNLPFSYVILYLLFTFVSYMHETWSWHAYRFALVFFLEKQVWHVVYGDSGIFRGMPDSLHQGLSDSIPTRRFLGTAWESCPRGGSLPCVWVYLASFKSIDCRPLTVIRDCLINWQWYPIMMEPEEYGWMN